MDENVALDPSKQKKFVRSVKGIKKLIKKNEIKKLAEVKTPSIVTSEEDVQQSKNGRDKKRKRKPLHRGLVYLSHIPHGFYEDQMTQYFKQFGGVSNVRVIRSKRTGRSKGFAFVEFKEPAVAQIVAETMNNYLMGKRLIKAVYIPPEKIRPGAMRKHWNTENNPGRNLKINLKKKYNANKDEAGELQRARKLLSNLNKTKKKLAALGINYDFFVPVDVPAALKDDMLIKKESTESKKPKIIKKEKNTDEKPNQKRKDAQTEGLMHIMQRKKRKNKLD